MKNGIHSLLGTAGLVACAAGLPAVAAEERPNFVLIASEDNSVHFASHFFEGGAQLPNIEGLAGKGITFDHAFANAPVCSVARTTVITSMYAPRVATHHHRGQANAILPEGWKLFPAYLREAGYFTVKRGKKDFNVTEGAIWDSDGNQAHWRDRPDEDTPFFFMTTIHDTHEGRLHFDRETMESEPAGHDPDAVEVFPYLPDTPTVRYTHAFYLDRHLDMDEGVGNVLEQLEQDGLRESTIVIYYGDHGGVLPRSKGHLYEGGLHVPVVVYIPEKFQQLSPFDPGERVEGFIEFVDFGPTVLNLAGVGLPGHLDGKPFLGADVTKAQVNSWDETFGYADRFDEKYDMVRSLRKGDYKYIRNYWPHYPHALLNEYRYRQLAYQEWRELYKAGELDAVQRKFFEPRGAEELYDLAADPHETENLVDDPAYDEVLRDLRGRMRQRMRSLPDLGVFPESYLLQHAVGDPRAFGQENVTRITHLLNVADLSLKRFADARPGLEEALASDDPWKRYWALVVCAGFGERAAVLADTAESIADRDILPVRVQAAEFLGTVGRDSSLEILYQAATEADNESDALLALNTLTYLRDHRELTVDVGQINLNDDVEGWQIRMRIEYLESTP